MIENSSVIGKVARMVAPVVSLVKRDVMALSLNFEKRSKPAAIRWPMKNGSVKENSMPRERCPREPPIRTNWPRPRKFDSDSDTSPMKPSAVE